MGNFAAARQQFKKAKSAYDASEAFFYVIPEATSLKRLTTTMSPASGSGKSVKVVTRQIEEAAQWKYFPVHVKVPAVGLWRIRISSGGEQGCFVVRFDT